MPQRRRGAVEVLLVHPGGPFWANKDDGAWSIPKGVYEPDEDPLAAARREFAEETGAQLDGEATALGSFRQSAAKIVDVWAVEGEFDPAAFGQHARGARGRPGRVVHARGGVAQTPQGAASDSRGSVATPGPSRLTMPPISRRMTNDH